MPLLDQAEYHRRLRDVRLLVTDVDGVLTDGSIVYSESEGESKIFQVRDGSGFYIARLIGLEVAVITARSSEAVRRRFSELPVRELRQGTFDKLSAVRALERHIGLETRQVAYLGDDLVDLPSVIHAGVGICVRDAHHKLLERSDWRTRSRGGRGAFREVIDDIVDARDLWPTVLRDYHDRQDLESS